MPGRKKRKEVNDRSHITPLLQGDGKKRTAPEQFVMSTSGAVIL